jgi:pimeloyl-ACP methyl ester carboxylesterase
MAALARELVTIDDGDITYLRAGSGPPLVLLHGIGGNAWQFRHQIDGLFDAFDLIAWDAPGYGGSSDPGDGWLMPDYAGRLAAILDALGIERPHLLGQSWGGMLAQVFAGRYPERVRSLVLSDTGTGGRSQPEEERLASLNARLRAVETMTPREMAVARAPAVLGPNPTPSVRDEAIAMMAEIRPTGYRQAAVAIAELDTRAILPSIDVPTLVIAGQHDAIVPPATAEYLRDHIPGARLVVLPGAGHLSGQERPAEYNAALREFLVMSDE